MMRDYDEIFKAEAATHLPGSDWRRLKAQAFAESSLRFDAVSICGAIGIMQIMPRTAAELGVPEDALRDPKRNIHAGAEYMRRMLLAWETSAPLPGERWAFALASYNAGLSNVRQAHTKAIRAGLEGGHWACVGAFLRDVTGRHARETLNYVARVQATYSRLIQEDA